jgi:hypothetical protein
VQYELQGYALSFYYSPAGTGGGANEEDNPDSVYMFAWALDGRRIGESGVGPTNRAESPNSITAPLINGEETVRGMVCSRGLLGTYLCL